MSDISLSSQGPPETVLEPEPPDCLAALDAAEGRDAVAAVWHRPGWVSAISDRLTAAPATHHADYRQPSTDIHEPIIPSGPRTARR